MLLLILVAVVVSMFVIGYTVKKQSKKIQALEGIMGKKK